MLKNPYEYKRVARTQQELNVIMQEHERYIAGQGGLRAQLAHANLDGLILANRNLQEADFSGASLVGASLYGSILNRVNLYCADLRDCDLRMTKLVRADMRGASFNGAKLAYAVLDNADLRTGIMMYVGADGASLVHRKNSASDSTKQPHSVDFSNCSMKGASFGNAKLDGANFTGALLHGAIFKNAVLKNSVFKNAVLTGVNMADLHVPPEALEGCVQDITAQAAARCGELKLRLDAHQQWIASQGQQGRPAVLDGEDLRPLDKPFVGRHLSGLSARNAIGIGIDFSGGQLQAAKFDGADLRGANFSKADIRGASFKGTKLLHAIFDGADLRPLHLAGGTLLSADLTSAEVTDEQLHNAIRDDVS